nr:hypothetical protein [Arthrobacter nitrophenolicus]
MSIHTATRITEALLACVGSADAGAVATVDDFEEEILFREAVRNFTSSPFRHRSLAALLQQDAELAGTCVRISTRLSTSPSAPSA